MGPVTDEDEDTPIKRKIINNKPVIAKTNLFEFNPSELKHMIS